MGVVLSGAQAEQLQRLLSELAIWGRTYNLTAIESPVRMLALHVLDSLAASADLEGERIADLGTGAGFPGLPLAIVHPQRRFTLIDGTAKKIRFVAHAVRALGLTNVEALQARAESWRPAAPFDTIVVRAVAALPALCALARPLARAGTHLLAYKGQQSEIERELAEFDRTASLRSAWRLLGVRRVTVPGLEAERGLVTLVAL